MRAAWVWWTHSTVAVGATFAALLWTGAWWAGGPWWPGVLFDTAMAAWGYAQRQVEPLKQGNFLERWVWGTAQGIALVIGTAGVRASSGEPRPWRQDMLIWLMVIACLGALKAVADIPPRDE